MHLVICESKSKEHVKKTFLVKDAFDSSDAILKVKKTINSTNDLTFTVKHVYFNQYEVCPIT